MRSVTRSWLPSHRYYHYHGKGLLKLDAQFCSLNEFVQIILVSHFVCLSFAAQTYWPSVLLAPARANTFFFLLHSVTRANVHFPLRSFIMLFLIFFFFLFFVSSKLTSCCCSMFRYAFSRNVLKPIAIKLKAIIALKHIL